MYAERCVDSNAGAPGAVLKICLAMLLLMWGAWVKRFLAQICTWYPANGLRLNYTNLRIALIVSLCGLSSFVLSTYMPWSAVYKNVLDIAITSLFW